MGVPILLAPIFGPIIGGLIVDNAPWQWIFVVNVPIAVVAILVAVRLLQADAGRADPGPFDWLGRRCCAPGSPASFRALGDREPRGHRPSDFARAGRRRARSGRRCSPGTACAYRGR